MSQREGLLTCRHLLRRSDQRTGSRHPDLPGIGPKTPPAPRCQSGQHRGLVSGISTMSQQSHPAVFAIRWHIQSETGLGELPGYALRQRSQTLTGHSLLRCWTVRSLAFRTESAKTDAEIFESRIELPFYGAIEPEPIPGRRISYTRRLRRPLLILPNDVVRMSAQKVRRSHVCRSLRACVFQFR